MSRGPRLGGDTMTVKYGQNHKFVKVDVFRRGFARGPIF